MSACNCEKRPIIDAVGKSVKNFYEVYVPYYSGATTSGKTIIAGPIEIPDAFENCGGSGIIRSCTVKEFDTSQKLPFDIIFAGLDGYAISTNTTTAFDATVAEANYLQDSIEIAGADYVDKGQYQEARASLVKPLTVFNRATTEGDKKKLWFYVVARGVKTFTSATRLAIQISIEND